MARFFISYSRVDETFTARFVELLRNDLAPAPTHYVWYDRFLTGTQTWWDEILSQIAQADVFIYLLSNESVSSPYCRAEFEEARRLRKIILTVQVRDRTALQGVLADLQYVDMKRGMDDGASVARLAAAITLALSKIPARRPRPLWMPVTPKPLIEQETQRATDAPEVDTLPLVATMPASATLTQTGTQPIPTAPQPQPAPARRPIWPVLMGVLAVLGIAGFVLAQGGGGGAQPTLTPEPTAVVAQASDTPAAPTATDALSPTPSTTPSITPTPEPTTTPDIQAAAQTVVAQETENYLNTLAAQTVAAATLYQAQTQTQAAAWTATATQWTPTFTPDLTLTITALVADWATQTQAANATATATLWTDTPTPTPTFTPTHTPTATFTPTPTPTPNATTTLEARAAVGIAANADWEPVEQVFDGVTMVLVPAGCFQMGSEDGESDERPAHEVCIEAPFWLDKFEVTQADFERLGGVKAEANRFDGDARPVERITWFEAEAFCRERRGGRLPSEAEWEFAARGPDGLEYPWRGEFVAENVVFDDNANQTADVGEGIRTGGASWVGAHDLSGNVWEWVSTSYGIDDGNYNFSEADEKRFTYPYRADDGREEINSNTRYIRVLRGGSWDIALDDLRAANRNYYTPDDWYYSSSAFVAPALPNVVRDSSGFWSLFSGLWVLFSGGAGGEAPAMALARDSGQKFFRIRAIMKTFNRLYPDIIRFETLYRAWRKARLGKRYQPAVAAFERDLDQQLIELQDRLSQETWQPGGYRSFTVHEPKRRKISAAPFADRVVHHALIRVLEPIYERKFIADSYANRKGKGTHKALDRCSQFMRRFRYVLPCDVKQFFPSIDHQVLKSILSRTLACQPTLGLCDKIIDSGRGILDGEYEMHYFDGDDLFAVNRPRGLPIGNLTSQFWANVYLNPLDQFVKHTLRCRGYVRYVDDFVLFADDKQTLHTWRAQVIAFLAGLRLTLHETKAQPRPVQHGLPFLGFTLYPTHRRLKRQKGVAYQRRLRGLWLGYQSGKLSRERGRSSVMAWLGHIRHGNTHGLRRAILRWATR
jgi:formylglycine-generating enzyme required for sulfatase activity